MSGLEAIPIATGIVSAIAAAKSLWPGRKNEKRRVRFDDRNDRSHRDGRHSRRGRARERSSSRSSRAFSLRRDSPHSIAFSYESRSQSRWSGSNSERIRSKGSRRISYPNRRSSRRRRHRSSSYNGKRCLYDDDRARRRIMPSPDEEAPRLDFCNGRVDKIQRKSPNGSHTRDVYICKDCNLEIVKFGIRSWHRFLANDRGEVDLHKNFILRSHEARDGKFGCRICPSWFKGYKSLVFHLMDHRYSDLENVVPESEWKGSEDLVYI